MSVSTNLTPYEQLTKINDTLSELLIKLNSHVIIPANDLLVIGDKILTLYEQINKHQIITSDDKKQLNQIETQWQNTVTLVNNADDEITIICKKLTQFSDEIEAMNNKNTSEEIKNHIEQVTESCVNIMLEIRQVTPELLQKDKTISKINEVLNKLKAKISESATATTSKSSSASTSSSSVFAPPSSQSTGKASQSQAPMTSKSQGSSSSVFAKPSSQATGKAPKNPEPAFPSKSASDKAKEPEKKSFLPSFKKKK